MRSFRPKVRSRGCRGRDGREHNRIGLLFIVNQLKLPSYDARLWFECNTPLLEAIQQPTTYGFSTAGELLAAVARERNLSPRALTKQLEAVRFLRSVYPELVASGQVQGGYSQTEYLQKIHGVSAKRADELASRVVNGEISMATMRQEFDHAISSRGHGGSTGAMARRRVIEFEHACRTLLETRIEDFSGGKPATVSDRFDLNGQMLDYAVIDGGRVLCAVECRIGGMRNTQREAFDLVAKLAMYTRKAETSCLLLPESAKALSDMVREVLSRWRVDRVFVGIVTEGSVHDLHLTQMPN